MPNMTKRKKIIIGTAVSFVILLVVGSILGYRSYRIYHETYILIDEVEYRRDASSLDLSGKPIAELEKLKELTQLEQLDLRGTGITTGQYEDLQAALPGCRILWSVPFQDGYCDNTVLSLSVDTLSEADFAAFQYLPNLSGINAAGCRDYDAIFKLIAQYPEFQVTYDVTMSGTNYPNGCDTLTITGPDAEEVMANLQYLPDVKTVYLEGTLPEADALIGLKEAYPGITFIWEFDMFGVTVNTLSEFVDLSGIEMENTEALEALLPCFYNLTQVDMVDCGISNEEMAALNKRHEKTKFVWKVYVAGMYLRTDEKFFMPAKYRLGAVTTANCANLKYCTDMLVLDFGHKKISNVDFIEYMPNLKYLLLCEAQISDLTVISNCTSLEYLEIFLTPVSDFWPLLNLTNLRDLNISGTPCYEIREDDTCDFGVFGDVTPLCQMTWLDRLWATFNPPFHSQQTALREALPNTYLVFNSTACTTSGFRYTPRYYQQRDILDMPYFHN